MNLLLVIISALAYLLLLFLVALWAEGRMKRQKSLTHNPYVYALSLAVYCTAWTYYGSVGRAASTGIGFLPIYLGPALTAPLWFAVLRKIITISKSQRITSIADFLSARYGKSNLLGGMVALMMFIGIIPYISLQLKAIADSFELLTQTPLGSSAPSGRPFFQTIAFWVTVVMAFFTTLFGARHLEANERHEGLVVAVAFESLIKLLAFLAVGLFVAFGLFGGFGDIFRQAALRPEFSRLFSLDNVPLNAASWFAMMLISMFAVLLLPRQFHIAVVENSRPANVNKAIWIFPLYLLVINIFVLPIAFGGLLSFDSTELSADAYVLGLPLAAGQNALALLVFLGGFSAATGMVIVATTALSLMLANNLVVPLLLRTSVVQDRYVDDVAHRLIGVRRVLVVLVLLLSYAYYNLIGNNYSLVSIGLISFVAVAQFGPALLAGLYWKEASKHGAIAGILLGFGIWAFCLPIPSLAESGYLPPRFIDQGLWGNALLRPYALLGIPLGDPITHATFWSLTFNVLGLVVGSLFSRRSVIELTQARLFVDAHKYLIHNDELTVFQRSAPLSELRVMLQRFLGTKRANQVLASFARRNQLDLSTLAEAPPALVNLAEKLLSGAMGTVSGRLLINSLVKEELPRLEEVMSVLDETQQIIRYSHALEEQSRALRERTEELRAANTRLQRMDRLKDEFLTTVTHELRTPLTSIMSLTAILANRSDLPEAQRRQFLTVITEECQRLARLINQVLDLEKMESGHADWNMQSVTIGEVVDRGILAVQQLIDDKKIDFVKLVPSHPVYLHADADRLIQVVVNLLGNAIKFCPDQGGRIRLAVEVGDRQVVFSIRDNGSGITAEQQAHIFEKFTQFNDYKTGRQGSGLGLSISQQIVHAHGGRIWVESVPDTGTTFLVELPRQKETATPKTASA